MAELEVSSISQAGVEAEYEAAAAGGDTFANDGRTVLHVKNANAASRTVTINSIAACSYGFDHDIAVAIPAGEERMIGPFPTARFGAEVEVTYSAVTDVTVAAFRLAFK